jgi:uncharacterized damage-inducible protein DinB
MMSCIEMLVNHNLIVRSSILEILERLSAKDFVRDLGNGIGSIRDILVHLIDTERYWISVLMERSNMHLDPADFHSIGDIKAVWCETEELTKGFLKDLSQEQLSHVRSVKRNERTVYFTIEKALVHLAAHEINHHGQIVGLIKQLGLDPPDTDML